MKNLIATIGIIVVALNLGFAQVPTNGLVAYYPFNGNDNDESDNGHNCTLTNCTTVADRFGHANSAYYFNGSTSVISATVGNAFSVSQVTLSAWVKPEGYTKSNPRIVAVGTPDYVYHYYSLLWHDINSSVSPGTFCFYSRSMGEYYSSSAFPVDNAWHHLAVTYNGTIITFYKDGAPDGTVTPTGNLEQFSSAMLRIGNNWNNNDPFQGAIDDIRIYNRALSDAEVQAAYHEGEWPTAKEEFFDDFHYKDRFDSRLSSQLWSTVNSQGSKPPCSTSIYDPSLIEFAPNSSVPGDTIMLVQTNVTQSATAVVNSRMETSGDKTKGIDGELFFEGTYAARVYLINTLDANVETFYTYHGQDGVLDHSEVDFEYLPRDVWSDGLNPPGTGLYMSSYGPNGTDKAFGMSSQNAEGWHILLFRIHDGVVEYLVDDSPVSYSTGVYPTHYMNLSFANWIDQDYRNGGCPGYWLDPSTSNRKTGMSVDWVYHAANVNLSKQQVVDAVTKYRSQSIFKKNTMQQGLLGRVTKTVVAPGTIDFSDLYNKTAVKVVFTNISGSGSATASRFGNPPVNPVFSGTAPKFVSPFRWVLNQAGLTSFTATVIFSVLEIGKPILSLASLTVFKRSVGGALFEPVLTRYNQLLNQIEADVTDFSEFIFCSDSPITTISPHVKQVPGRFELSQNYPNPFNPTTTIRYGLPQRSSVTLSAFNTLGQQVATLVNESQQAGYHEVKFDGTNLASGVYFYRIQAGDFMQTKRLLLLR